MNNLHQPIEIELDPQNPAHFFACCGLLELASRITPTATACFDANSYQYRKARFWIFNIERAFLASAFGALRNARAEFAHVQGFHNYDRSPVLIEVVPIEEPEVWFCIELDWWLPPGRPKAWDAKEKRWKLQTSDFKLWGGQQKTLKLVTEMLAGLPDDFNDILSHRKPMSGRFGLDPRSAWNTQDFGSSPDEQGRKVFTYPAAEMFAAIGLQGFRPKATDKRKEFAYYPWFRPLPVASARAAAAGALKEVVVRAFVFTVDGRSKSYKYFTIAQPQ